MNLKSKLIGAAAAFIFNASLALATPLQAAPRAATGTNSAVPNRPISTHRTAGATTAAAARTPRIAALDARLLARYDRLAARLGAANAAAVWNDFVWLQSAGYPIGSLDDYADSLESGIVTAGTPGTLLLDYWGAPLSQQSTTINGLWGEIWTYRRSDGLLVRVVVAGGVVTQVF